MSRGIYTTFSSDSEERSFLDGVLPTIVEALEVPVTTRPIYSQSLASIIRAIYTRAEASSSEEHLYVIFTDLDGDETELVRLLASSPQNVGIQLAIVNATGARKVAAFHHLLSQHLSFMILAMDEETEQVLDQLITDESRGGNTQN